MKLFGHNKEKKKKDEYRGNTSNYDLEKSSDINTTSMKRLVDRVNGGDATAQFQLGMCYEKGCGVTQDYKLAAYWDNVIFFVESSCLKLLRSLSKTYKH